MKLVLCFTLLFFVFSSCEKTPEGSGNGYFKGIVNGNTIISESQNNKYEPFVTNQIDYFCPIAKSYLGIGFSSEQNGDDLIVSLFIDGIDEVKGKMYKNFTPPKFDLSERCENIPTVNMGLRYSRGYEFEYVYIPHKNNYLKIENVDRYFVYGHFRLKFIRKQFLERGISSLDKQNLPDSMFIDCKQFLGHIRQ